MYLLRRQSNETEDIKRWSCGRLTAVWVDTNVSVPLSTLLYLHCSRWALSVWFKLASQARGAGREKQRELFSCHFDLIVSSPPSRESESRSNPRLRNTKRRFRESGKFRAALLIVFSVFSRFISSAFGFPVKLRVENSNIRARKDCFDEKQWRNTWIHVSRVTPESELCVMSSSKLPFKNRMTWTLS